MPDRRQFLRLESKIPVSYRVVPSSEQHLTPSANVGGGGICVVMPKPILPGKFIEVELTIPDPVRIIPFRGQVVWCREDNSEKIPRYKVGLEILFIDGEDHRCLTRFCLKRHGGIPPEALDIP